VDAFVPPQSGQSGGLREPTGVLFGPDHNLYVSSRSFDKNGPKAVLQYNGTTGAFLGDFADQHQLFSPQGMIFGPDGNLYVASSDASGTVVRYNGTTGAFMDDFVPAGGALTHAGPLLFGPDGDLYVGSHDLNNILRYDGTTGAFLGTFVAPGSGGLQGPMMMAFGPDGDLYVTSFITGSPFAPGSVLRYEGPSGPNPGAFLGTFVPAGSGGLANPTGLLFGPDGRNDGKLDLYVASSVIYSAATSEILAAEPDTSEVLRYDGTTGAFLNTFVTPDSGGLRLPTFMTFTETDPTTLNYVGQPSAPCAPAATLAQPATGTTPTTSPKTAAALDPTLVALQGAAPALAAWPGPRQAGASLVPQATLTSVTADLAPPPRQSSVEFDPVAAHGTPSTVLDRVFADFPADPLAGALQQSQTPGPTG
jgi:hypothetical protein